MRFFLVIVLLLATSAFAMQFYRLLKQQNALRKELTSVSQQLEEIETENKKLTADYEYFQNPKHLENEFRKAGYAQPDEKMVIIIPKQ